MGTEHKIADLIIHNGSIITVDDKQPEVEALAIQGEHILRVGTVEEVMQHKGENTQLLDLQSKTVMPGLVEPHGHPMLSALIHGAPVVSVGATSAISSVTVPTYDGVIAKIKRRVAKAKPGEYLFFVGLDPALHENMREPTLEELDQLAPNNPLALQTSNVHALYVNSLVLKHHGIQQNTANPLGGHIQRDSTGQLTGKLEEAAAMQICKEFYAECGDERTRREFHNWIWKFVHAGITTGTEIALMPYHLPYYQELVADGKPPLRMFGYEYANKGGTTAMSVGSGDDYFGLIGVKIVSDGSPFVGNIWVTRPYLNTEVTLKKMGIPENNTGQMSYSLEDLQHLINTYVQQGWQMAIHTQGDRTIDTVLDCYEQALEKWPREDHRFRLEHCSMLRDDQIERANKLGVVCSFFLAHLYYWGEALQDHMFGPQVAEHYMPIGSASKSGMRISFHSDPPMTNPSPLLCIQLAVTRKSKKGNVIGGTEQTVDIDTAIRSVTLDAAYHLFMEDKIGSLESGKYADMTILSDNPRSIDPNLISEITVEGTYLGGRAVFTKND